MVDPKFLSKWAVFEKWLGEKGVHHEKVLYPSIFQVHPNVQYMGMIAIDDIGSYESFVTVPSSIVITPKLAYYGELNHIFKSNPEWFTEDGDYTHWEDYILITFLLYEKQKNIT